MQVLGCGAGAASSAPDSARPGVQDTHTCHPLPCRSQAVGLALMWSQPIPMVTRREPQSWDSGHLPYAPHGFLTHIRAISALSFPQLWVWPCLRPLWGTCGLRLQKWWCFPVSGARHPYGQIANQGCKMGCGLFLAALIPATQAIWSHSQLKAAS